MGSGVVVGNGWYWRGTVGAGEQGWAMVGTVPRSWWTWWPGGYWWVMQGWVMAGSRG